MDSTIPKKPKRGVATPLRPDRVDWGLALALGVLALAAYVRTLAPDVLYSDAGEFQTLAYTLGMTHSTGYSIYLLLGRLIGLLPLGSPAWRINLLSAVGAAMTVSGVTLLARYLTRSRIGAALGGLALALSYTFWSQAIIAEVYTPATAVVTAALLLLWHWQTEPTRRYGFLLGAALLLCAGFGVHASVVLFGPAAAVLVLWTLIEERATWPQWRRALGMSVLGAVLGVALFVGTYLIIDARDTPTSFYQVALIPSRSAWGLEESDLATPFGRMWHTVTGRQWQDAMFPEHSDFVLSLGEYFRQVMEDEFSFLLVFVAVAGGWVAWERRRRLGAFLIVGVAVILYFVLHYEPGDKYVFYMPSYVLLATAIGVGAGWLLEQVARLRPAWTVVLRVGVLALLALMVIAPHAEARVEALRAGEGTFVRETYPYPLGALDEPRLRATVRLSGVPQDAVLLMDWRELYATYYIAHVEMGRTDIIILEATPHGSGGRLADTMIETINAFIAEGRPVYAEALFAGTQEAFHAVRALGGAWYRLLPREG